MTKVAEVCSFEKPEEKWKRVYLLSNMERDQIYDLFKHTTISSVSFLYYSYENSFILSARILKLSLFLLRPREAMLLYFFFAILIHELHFFHCTLALVW